MFGQASLRTIVAGVFATLVSLGLAMWAADPTPAVEPWAQGLRIARVALPALGGLGLAATLASSRGSRAAAWTAVGLLVIVDLLWTGYCAAFVWLASRSPDSEFHAHDKSVTLIAGSAIVLLFIAAGAVLTRIASRALLARPGA